MELSNAAKWTIFNRVLTAGAMLLGTGIALLGFVLGFWGSIETLVVDGNVQAAVDNANPILTLVLAGLGFLVWQMGKTYALFWSLPRASGRAAAKRFDHGRLKSEVVEALDGRLAEMEEDVAETRRSVQELKRTEHAAAFNEQDALESTPVQQSKPTDHTGTTAKQSASTDHLERATQQSEPAAQSEIPNQSQSHSAESSPSGSGESAESGFEFSAPDDWDSERSGAQGMSTSQSAQSATEQEESAASPDATADQQEPTDADDPDPLSESDESQP